MNFVIYMFELSECVYICLHERNHSQRMLASNLIECWFNSLTHTVQFNSVQIRISKCRLPSSLVCARIHSLTQRNPRLVVTHVYSISVYFSLLLSPFLGPLSLSLRIYICFLTLMRTQNKWQAFFSMVESSDDQQRHVKQ